MKTAKYAGPTEKAKRLKKKCITRKEYQKTTASRVNDSLDRFFKKKRPS
jgi:hypothetical protein